MSDAVAWARAYARQAAADWLAHDLLVELHDKVPRSESLHLLQMAVEKFVKAHLHLTRPDPIELRQTHAVIAKHLPAIFIELYAHQQRGAMPSGTLVKYVRRVARELDGLHPSITGGGRPDNCEYPWKDLTGQIHVPAEHSFEQMDAATREKSWLRLVQLMKSEMSRLAKA